MGSQEGWYVLAGEVNQPEKQAELMDIESEQMSVFFDCKESV